MSPVIYNNDTTNEDPEQQALKKKIQDLMEQRFQNHEINFRYEQIGDRGISIFMNQLLCMQQQQQTSGSRLKKLFLGGNKIGNEGCTAIEEFLKQDTTTIEALWLDNNAIGDEGIKKIANALLYKYNQEQNKTTAKMNNEEDNKIGSTLKELILTRNKIGDEGCMALSEVLKLKNNRLQALDFHNNNIGNQSVYAIATILEEYNTSITFLSLSFNTNIDNEEETIQQSLDKIRFYTNLNHVGRSNLLLRNPQTNSLTREKWISERMLPFCKNVYPEYRLSSLFYCLQTNTGVFQ